MILENLEVAPACELVFKRTSVEGVADPIDENSTLPRGLAVDEQGLVQETVMTVILEKDGQKLEEFPVHVRLSGFVYQTSSFEASDTWDEAWLSDGRVRVRAGTPGPAGHVNGLVWK